MFFKSGISNLDCTVGPMPILLYIPHLDGNILVLHPLFDKIIEWWGSFLILWNIFVTISPSSSTLLIGTSRYDKRVHILHVSRARSFSLYLIFCSCLHRKWLKWKLRPVIKECGKTLFIALRIVASKSSFIILVTRKNTNSSVQLTKNCFLFARSANRTFHAVCFRDLRISYTRVRCGAVGWGTALQAKRSRVQFPMVSLEFFIDIILPAALWPWSWLSL